MKNLLIDDLRIIPGCVIARTYNEGIARLKEGGWEILFLDHDLGVFGSDGSEKTGYDIICWIEENPEYKPQNIVCVSMNPVGRQKIQKVIAKLYG